MEEQDRGNEENRKAAEEDGKEEGSGAAPGPTESKSRHGRPGANNGYGNMNGGGGRNMNGGGGRNMNGGGWNGKMNGGGSGDWNGNMYGGGGGGGYGNMNGDGSDQKFLICKHAIQW